MHELIKVTLEKAGENPLLFVVALVSVIANLDVRAKVAELKAWTIERQAEALKDVPTVRELESLDDRVRSLEAVASRSH
jgi:hypothetical protein